MSGNEIVITETGGEGRSITLRGHSMPKANEEPATFGIQQRGRINYAPWQPVADVSILGAVWKPMTLRGLWDDKFMGPNDAPLLKKFKNASPTGRARNCTEIVDSLYLIIRSAETLKFEWGPHTRYGLIWEFDPGYLRQERVVWEMVFQWTGDSATKPIVKARPKLSPLGLLELLLLLLEALRNAIKILGAPARFYTNNILSPFNQLTSAIAGVIDELTKVIAGAITPSRVLGDLRAGFMKIKLACVDLLRALKLKFQFSDPTTPRDTAIGNYGVLVLSKAVRDTAAAMAEREREMAKLDTPDLIESVFTVQGETLRDVAKRIYGNASDWLLIANYNGLSQSVVPTNTLVLVPSKVKAA